MALKYKAMTLLLARSVLLILGLVLLLDSLYLLIQKKTAYWYCLAIADWRRFSHLR